MTTEFDLPCATCGSPLTRRTVSADHLPVETHGQVSVAECPNCGGKYFPERTLEQLARAKSGRRTT